MKVIRDNLKNLASDANRKRWIAEFVRLSGRGNFHAWRFNRDEIHDRSVRAKNLR
ncbi:MAG: hypothetical protein ACRD3L_07485 [Terriglobales bacterium]